MVSLPVRLIRVTEVRRVTPHLARITFAADAAGVGGEPDQQVKLYFPKPGQAVPRMPDASDDFTSWYAAFTAIPDAERPWMRSYTLRGHDARRGTVDIDFVLHDHAGPATRWAMSAAPGDTLAMFGPSAMFARPVPILSSIEAADWVLMAGDETALPAIGTLAEALPAGTRAVAFVEVRDTAEEQELQTRGELTVHWIHRDASGVLLDAVRAARFPAGSVLAWLAGEAGAVRALRRHLVDERGVPKRSIDFAGYWRLHLTQDDDPTGEDLADAQDLLARAQELLAGRG